MKPRRFLAPKTSLARWQLPSPLPGLGSVAVAVRAGSVGGSVGPRWAGAAPEVLELGLGPGFPQGGLVGSGRQPSAPGFCLLGSLREQLGGALGWPSWWEEGAVLLGWLSTSARSRRAVLAPQRSSSMQGNLRKRPAGV